MGARAPALLVLLAASPWHALRIMPHARVHAPVGRPRLRLPRLSIIDFPGDSAAEKGGKQPPPNKPGAAESRLRFPEEREGAWRAASRDGAANVGYYLDELSQPFWRRNVRVEVLSEYPVGTPEANPEVGGRQREIQWFRGLRDDLRRRLPLYTSDWVDGVSSSGRSKSLAAISFLYFACLAPVVAFGGALSGLTQGAMGVSEVLLSCGICGMGYAALCGQPMTFVAPTGLTLAFTAALFRYCASLGLPFLPMYSWVGCWTALLLVCGAAVNASGLIRYCTRFTEDVFNALLGVNFLWEASRSLIRDFKGAVNTGGGMLALNMGLLTAYLLQKTSEFRSTRYLSRKWREGVSDFGPSAVIMGLSALSLLPVLEHIGTFSRLSMPGGFQLSGGRALFVNMLELEPAYRLLALIPAIFLSLLFFLDQNITVRTVNSPSHKLRKGQAYHLDLCALGVLTLFASLTGLPWMCSATVQSLNHVRAMTVYRKIKPKDGPELEVPDYVVETRVTGFGVHAAVLCSALAIPTLSLVPLPVVAGVFLYLGRKVMTGNQFIRRCKQLFLDEDELCIKTEGEKEQVILGRKAVWRFTAMQVMCLTVLWCLKLTPSTALIFPSVIGVLMILRSQLIPKLFTGRELMLLDTAIGATSA